ncbi:DUF3987 domain-containing protein [Saccharomonospora sp. NPDC006951]
MARARSWLPTLDDTVFDCYLGHLVHEIEPTSEADPVAILASLICAAGVRLGRRPHVRAGDDVHPLLVWPMVIGKTNTGKKGSSWSAAKRLIAEADGEFAVNNIKSGLTSGEGLAQRFAIDDEDDDASGPSDLRLLAFENEWGGVMAKMKREGNSLSQILRAAWEGGDLSTLTVNARVAPESHVGVLAHITPEEFRAKLSDADMAGGTYNRFLPLAVAWSKALPDSSGLDRATTQALASGLADRLNTGEKLGVMDFADDARGMWRDLYLEFNTDAHHPSVASFVSRALPYCKRIAGLHAALDGTTDIQLAHLQPAAALVRYSIDSARALFVDTATPAKLLAWITEGGDAGRTRKEISKDFFGGNKPAEQITALLGQLVDAGRIRRERREPASGKGRPTEAYTAVPAPEPTH